MKKAKYEEELKKLQVELVNLQDWVKETGQRIVVLFEGRDAAGKGGVIKAISERVSPRVFRVIALPAPSDREKTQLYSQRYMQHLPAAGEIVIFDRSWYNRAGVERVMGFASEEQVEHFLNVVPKFEEELVRDGIILLKYWLEVSNDEQEKRFKSRIKNEHKQWKLSSMDLEARRRWYDYSRARDAMLEATDTETCPWFIVRNDDKERGRLNCIKHLLSQIPYESTGTTIVKLPDRDESQAYDDAASIEGRNFIPEEY
ncbi:MAG: polyphosphate kinase 2 [Halieaceae bacterium]|nr:polyphosphate kinase 2 [Halieaceae bacterium]